MVATRIWELDQAKDGPEMGRREASEAVQTT